MGGAVNGVIEMDDQGSLTIASRDDVAGCIRRRPTIPGVNAVGHQLTSR